MNKEDRQEEIIALVNFMEDNWYPLHFQPQILAALAWTLFAHVLEANGHQTGWEELTGCDVHLVHTLKTA